MTPHSVLRSAAILALVLGGPPPALAQNPPDEPVIRDVGVGENTAAERLVRADAAAEAAAERGEEATPETPVAAEPLPPGQIDVGTVESTELEPDEEPDPAADD